MKLQKMQLPEVKKRLAEQWDKSKPKVIKGMKIASVIGVGIFIVAMDKLFHGSDDAFENWLNSASDEELSDSYEERRLEWLKDNHGDITPEMSKINDEMVRRMNEKYKEEHPNAEVRHREHGWYLPNDD